MFEYQKYCAISRTFNSQTHNCAHAIEFFSNEASRCEFDMSGVLRGFSPFDEEIFYSVPRNVTSNSG